MNGAPVSVLRGAPLRLRCENEVGFKMVKWIAAIEFVHDFADLGASQGTVNLYTAFLGLVVALTKPGGEIVAIIPRSFCNGMYFRPFQKWLLHEAALTQIQAA
jgi:DMSO/TMAO reductase YedYZ molybdopterin-dependent catalytic subunit